MTRNEFVLQVNEWGAAGIPFLFITDFELENLRAVPLDKVNAEEILYSFRGVSNKPDHLTTASPVITHKIPEPLESYRAKYEMVYKRLSYGDSYLVNLTTKTKVELSHSLQEIFFASDAPYKLLVNDQFLVFSPECFVRIRDGRIYSYPMKGTIDAGLPGAREKILHDQKEMAEHVTIVDLIRNDLSQVASHVTVTRFRYIDEIKTSQKDLLQVSSEICGVLPEDYTRRLGDLLLHLLPAGSISGAPKAETLDIIKEAEKEKRGYYTGVFGYFNGTELDSGVMIRFIEKQNDSYYYRSGGGITTQSQLFSEYQEIIDKVYVPVN